MYTLNNHCIKSNEDPEVDVPFVVEIIVFVEYEIEAEVEMVEVGIEKVDIDEESIVLT